MSRGPIALPLPPGALAKLAKQSQQQAAAENQYRTNMKTHYDGDGHLFYDKDGDGAPGKGDVKFYEKNGKLVIDIVDDGKNPQVFDKDQRVEALGLCTSFRGDCMDFNGKADYVLKRMDSAKVIIGNHNSALVNLATVEDLGELASGIADTHINGKGRSK